jgi:hypothetical protein
LLNEFVVTTTDIKKIRFVITHLFQIFVWKLNHYEKYNAPYLLLYSNASFAQLKSVKYNEGTQVLNGFEICPTKKLAQNQVS